jgi:hypothetical protein
MRIAPQPGRWVVYHAPVRESAAGVNAVCGQAEWDAMDQARPGYYTLIRAGIASESEAERLARGTSGDPVPKAARRSSAQAMVNQAATVGASGTATQNQPAS